MKNIKVIDVIKSEFAVSPEDGDSLYVIIEQEIESYRKVSIDFDGIEIMTTAFLNNAIGKLYKNFDKSVLNEYIIMKNISESDIILLKKAIDRAKITFNKDMIEELEEEF